MKLRHKRLAIVAIGLAALAGATALVLNAFQSNLVFFFSPTDVHAGKAPVDRVFRIGGLVKEGSVQREPDGLTTRFVVTDTARVIPAVYSGILPDLFAEGKGVVADGKLGSDGLFTANRVLAKHDYIPHTKVAYCFQADTERSCRCAGLRPRDVEAELDAAERWPTSTLPAHMLRRVAPRGENRPGRKPVARPRAQGARPVTDIRWASYMASARASGDAAWNKELDTCLERMDRLPCACSRESLRQRFMQLFPARTP
jgi:cytochrome c-type biogenesis protein CcmE